MRTIVASLLAASMLIVSVNLFAGEYLLGSCTCAGYVCGVEVADVMYDQLGSATCGGYVCGVEVADITIQFSLGQKYTLKRDSRRWPIIPVPVQLSQGSVVCRKFLAARQSNYLHFFRLLFLLLAKTKTRPSHLKNDYSRAEPKIPPRLVFHKFALHTPYFFPF